MSTERHLNAKGGVFQGVRVLDLSRAGAGPFATMILADLGAEVVKVETPEFALGVTTRQKLDPHYLFQGDDYHFLSLNRNKRSIVLDLRKEEGKEVFYQLVRKGDVVFDNMRPGARERLGVDFLTLKGINPRIICCSVTGYGQSGPSKDKPAFDLMIQASSGMWRVLDTRDERGRPRWPGVALADFGGGLWAACGIASALYARERTGEAQMVDVALQDGLMAFFTYLAAYWLNSGIARDPTRDHLWGAFKTKDGHIAIAAHREGFWGNLCRVLGREHWLADPRFNSPTKRMENKEELWAAIEEIIATRTANEWLKVLSEGDVPCAPINTLGEALADAQVLHRNMVVTIEHTLGGKIRVLGNPIKISGREEVFRSPPTLGQHTEEILATWLGYSREKIEELRKDQVV